VSAFFRLRDSFAKRQRPLKVLGASGQLGYGLPAKAFAAGVARQPDCLGCDMGSIDIGPHFLGSGEVATADVMMRSDLRQVLKAARSLDVPLLIGTAGSAGASSHLDATAQALREIAREEGLKFRLALIRADMPPEVVKSAARDGRVTPIGAIGNLTDDEIDAAGNIVGQMGTEAFARALEAGADVVLAGRACDTAIFAAVPTMLGFPHGPTLHMSKIIECSSLCCLPGGRDAILATLEGGSFVLESMNPDRRATPMSVAAHSLYEQSDPNELIEPDGIMRVDRATYEAVDERRCRIAGATWHPASQLTVKIEGARSVGERAVLLCGSADPRFISRAEELVEEVREVVRGLVCGDAEADYQLIFRLYGLNGVYDWREVPKVMPREIFIMAECIAATADRATTVVKTCKQFLLHHGYEGRLSTGGNIAFPFSPPEVVAGPAYRFNIYHIMAVDALAPLFPVELEDI
jgi:hypothetical protein